MAGCTVHDITEADVDKRYSAVNEKIAATPEDDHDAQWSLVFACVCCLGPARWYDQDKEPRCTRCA